MKTLRIVLLDYEKGFIRELKPIIEESGIAQTEVHVVQNETEALAVISNQQIDLVITSFATNENSTAIQFASAIDTDEVCCIVLDELEEQTHIVDAISIGIRDFVTKDKTKGYLGKILEIVQDLDPERKESRITRILIVEEHEADRFLVERFFSGHPRLKAEVVGNLEEAYEILACMPIHFVVVGYHVFAPVSRSLIGVCKEKEIPVLVLTGLGDPKVARQMMGLGAADFLEKETDMWETLEKVLTRIQVIEKKSKVKNQLSKMINGSKEQLVELEELAYAASHQLQEPLQTSVNFVAMLRDEIGGGEKGTSMVTSYLEVIEEANTTCQKLIAEMLRFGMMGRVTKMGMENLREIVHQVFSVVDVPYKINWEEFPTQFYCNREMVKELFVELIENAKKFAHPDRDLQLNVECENNSGTFVFRFSDNGIGVSGEKKHKIFRVFQTLNPRDVYPGLGMGLARVQKIARLHSGKIMVQSEWGAGSTFIFSLSK